MLTLLALMLLFCDTFPHTRLELGRSRPFLWYRIVYLLFLFLHVGFPPPFLFVCDPFFGLDLTPPFPLAPSLVHVCYGQAAFAAKHVVFARDGPGFDGPGSACALATATPVGEQAILAWHSGVFFVCS